MAVFKAQLKSFTGQTDKLLKDTAVRIALLTRKEVAVRTNKRTGRAAASWNLSVGVPDTRIKPETFNNPLGADDLGNISIASFQLGQNIYISNSIPYLPYINNGTLTRPPSAFVEASVMAIPAKVPQAVMEAKRKSLK